MGAAPNRKDLPMKAWIANLLWDALWIVAWRLHDFAFDPDRAAKARFRDRQRWWAYYCKAEQTESKKDDMRAEWFRIRFQFETPPDEALKRGDLEPRLGNGGVSGPHVP